MDSSVENTKENSLKDFKKCSIYEDWLLFFFLLNVIIVWLVITMYLVVGYLSFDFG